mmetsp:Transcript_96230/g.170883  ORF Transcript_96230/g.170883 Transcript_96230/m.170883 type:complete len:332 (-) Transcript_96230:54-1049(-)|eukprot:CAMPEP_0197642580 /NCGR_PEP_ID=MMETSP1338-20131121/16196_1 /TAXON_ID=43686 ORGANISM="Pelagodinium beii, Strain RCC1491" /NCGR_SAMPLE_ID=MMETSP1338 /ASSEMBLY_ACC=CAM_ASM_000754 /LENGTH=331 /DNA_ID=CAMNT_0043215721 /DNA_START=64 /DNA_END=1059 /DNA_ORIENTATION=+
MDLEAHELNEAKPLLGDAARAKDGMISRGKAQDGDEALTPKDFIKRMLTLIPAQLLLFSLMVFVVCKWYYQYPILVCLGAGLAVTKSAVAASIYKQRRWESWIGKLLLLASVTGFVTGLNIYYDNMVFYYHYRDVSTYTNVVASQPALTVADAGVIAFAAGSTIDNTRSVGYQSAIDGATVCVAPIVDASMVPGSTVNLYAYGVNCCGYRGSFDCDSARDASARSGMIMPDAADVAPPLFQSLYAGGPSAQGLSAAVKLQQTLFGNPKDQGKVLFLRYVKDPLAVQIGYLDAGILAALKASALFLLVLVAAGAAIVLGRERFWKAVAEHYK